MSKRLQILLPDDEFKDVQRVSRRLKCSVAELVREGIRARLAAEVREPPEHRIARVMAFAKHTAPTCDIDQMLAEIESGRNK
jgi:hypothetical protein